MNYVNFIELEADNKTIKRSGVCPAEEIAIHGNVRVLREKRLANDTTHEWDDTTRRLVQKKRKP